MRAMVARGHGVIAVAPDNDPDVACALSQMGVRYVRVPLDRAGLNPFADIRTLGALIRVLRSFSAEVVIAYTAKPVIYGMVAARLAGASCRAALITGIGSTFSGAGSSRRALATVIRTLYRVALRNAHIVFFQNPDDQALFCRLRLVGPHQTLVRVNGSGVDLSRFSMAPLPDEHGTRFLMISRLLRDKGVCEFVEAARLVRRSYPRTHFQLLGGLDPNPNGVSARELEAWRAEGVIEYLGTAGDVRPIIASSHVCVLPSYYGEGVPRFLLEAMAMGRPVLTTDSPGCRETVDGGRNGKLVAPRDAKALAGAMLDLIGRSPGLQEMGRQSRLLAEARFDVHQVNDRMLTALGL